MPLVETIVRLRTRRGLRLAIRELMALYGLEIPIEVGIGANLILSHRAHGTVIHPNTTIGDRVLIYHNVTVGRRDGYRIGGMDHIHIGNDVVLCPGSAVLGAGEPLTVAEGTVLGANSVLTTSTGPWEIWAGNPAVRVKTRDPATAVQLALHPRPR